MKILGIDPGLGITGYGVLDTNGGTCKLIEAGVIKSPSTLSLSARLNRIFTELKSLVDEYRPSTIVLEELYSHYKHPRTAILMGHARGVACLVSSLYDIRLKGYSATRIKKAITGRGHASKEQIKHMVGHMLDIKNMPKLHDVSDAIALALGYVQIEKHRSSLGKL